jgi:hypothetical protein
MRTPSFLSDRLREVLRVKKVATLPELKQALGTAADITVFRKLKELSYRSSYSHRGRYYTLDGIPQFDSQGLWSFHEVWFSRWGNLVTTLETLISAAPQGYFAHELQQLLHVEVKDASSVALSASRSPDCFGTAPRMRLCAGANCGHDRLSRRSRAVLPPKCPRRS